MKKGTLAIVLFSSLVIYPLKSQHISKTDKEDISSYLKIAINDFVETEKISKIDSVFHVDFTTIDENVIGVSIFGTLNKLVPTPENSIGSSNPGFPTKYCIINSKLFYWYDSTSIVNLDLVNVLSEYHQIDSVNVNGIIEIPEQRIDDSKKGVDYYFCRCNAHKYKKVTTNRDLGYYKPPRLKCRCE